VPISNMQEGFVWTQTYGYDLTPLCFPSDGAQKAPYPIYDRWADFFNVTTEASTTDTARSLAVAAWLAGQTSLATQPWRSTNATIIAPTDPKPSGQPVTISLQVADTNLNGAKIVWEGLGLDPVFDGVNHTFTPTSQSNLCWIEAEVQWPDGRRAFATNSIIVITNPLLQLSVPDLSDGGLSFQLAGVPQGTYVIQASADLKNWQPILTNSLPLNGLWQIGDPLGNAFPQRYYRVVKTP
jgi:hypothetical protein